MNSFQIVTRSGLFIGFFFQAEGQDATGPLILPPGSANCNSPGFRPAIWETLSACTASKKDLGITLRNQRAASRRATEREMGIWQRWWNRRKKSASKAANRASRSSSARRLGGESLEDRRLL